MYRFVLAGRLSAGVISNYLTAVITDMILIRIFVVRNRLTAVVTDMVFIPIGTIIRFGECTSVHRAFAGMRSVSICRRYAHS